MLRQGLRALVAAGLCGVMAIAVADVPSAAAPQPTSKPKPKPSPAQTARPSATASITKPGEIEGIAWKRTSSRDAPRGSSPANQSRNMSTSSQRSGPRPLTDFERWQQTTRMLPECNGVHLQPEEWCAWQEPPPGQPARPPRQGAEAVAREVVARLQLPPANPQVGPDPSWNEWNMAVVGHPLWLWVDGQNTLASSNSAYGIDVTLTASHERTTFAMGDGTTVTCASTQPYPRGAVEAGTPSPVCGHTYQKAPQHGTYLVSATTHWRVAWSAAGYTGTLSTTMTASRDLPVGELQAVVVRR